MSLAANLHTLDNATLQAAIGSTTSPLIITDNQLDDNPIIYANQAFLNLCGYSEEEIIGHNCRFLQGEGSKKQSIKQLHDAVRDSKSTRVTLKNYRKDGTPFWNDLVVSPITDKIGKTTHFIGMQLDITEREQYTQKLEQVQKRLKRSNQELEQFTYAASHDLQEPLRMVSSYLQLLDKRYGGSFDEDAKLFINFAVEGAERMQALINDLLTLSRVSSTAKIFKKVSLNEVVNKVQFNLKLLIDETGTELVIDDLPELEVDSVQMVQLLQNLIGNAIKYRRPNVNPKIHVTVVKEAGKYVFSISDNGIGIDPLYYERIFTIFQRLHTREEYPGTGVGLAICRKIIDRHGGKIWVESDSHGSNFKFSLPLKRKVIT